MVYQALYRKYRSQRFDEMIGQEVVTTTLKNAIINHQISHAYLFSGPRGTGKTSAAKVFAKAINCPNQKDGEPDNTCDICKAITAGTLEDVIELDAASNNGVDEIREIRDKSTYAASRATYKVYIIDEVHMLSIGAFNALLKTLEEPTANVVFVLATTELQKIPATIISRVQRFAFKSITTADIRQHLINILQKEKIDFDEKALTIIAKSAEGGMRDALSILDQALSFSSGKLEEKDALLVTGSIASEALVSYVEALEQSDGETALVELNKIFDEGKNMLRFTEDLLSYLRDLLLDEHTKISHNRLYQWIDIIIDSFRTLRETTQVKIVADVMTMRLIETTKSINPNNDSGISDNAQLIAKLQRQMMTLQEQVAQMQQLLDPITLPVKVSTEEQTYFTEESAESIVNVAHSSSDNAMPESKQNSVVQVPFHNRLVDILLQEAKKEIKTQIEMAWSEVIDSLTSQREIALLKITKVEAASEEVLILSVEHENLATIIVNNTTLIDQIDNVLSAATGFTPKIIVITSDEWQRVVSDFMAKRHTDKGIETKSAPLSDDSIVTKAQTLFGDGVTIIDD